MFDSSAAVGEIATLRGLVSSLGGLEVAEDDAGRIDQIRALEEVKAAAAAAQARVVSAFAASQHAAQAAVGVPAEQLGRGGAAGPGQA